MGDASQRCGGTWLHCGPGGPVPPLVPVVPCLRGHTPAGPCKDAQKGECGHTELTQAGSDSVLHLHPY